MRLTLSPPDLITLRAPLARCLSRPTPSGSAVSLIDEAAVIERILRHLGSSSQVSMPGSGRTGSCVKEELK